VIGVKTTGKGSTSHILERIIETCPAEDPEVQKRPGAVKKGSEFGTEEGDKKAQLGGDETARPASAGRCALSSHQKRKQRHGREDRKTEGTGWGLKSGTAFGPLRYPSPSQGGGGVRPATQEMPQGHKERRKGGEERNRVKRKASSALKKKRKNLFGNTSVRRAEGGKNKLGTSS